MTFTPQQIATLCASLRLMKALSGSVRLAHAYAIGTIAKSTLDLCERAYFTEHRPLNDAEIEELINSLPAGIVATNKHTDTELWNWLTAQTVDVIYLDDGRIIDVKGNDPRKVVSEAMAFPWEVTE